MLGIRLPRSRPSPAPWPATAPLFGLGLGFVVLAEALSIEIAVGALGISVGVAVLSWRGETRRQWPLYALLFPVGAAFLRAVGHAIVKIGFTKLPDPFFAALVAHNVSLVLALLNNRRGRRRRQRIPRAALPWLILTGLVLGIAVLVLNHAPARGPPGSGRADSRLRAAVHPAPREGAVPGGNPRSAGGDRGPHRGAERGPRLGPGRLSLRPDSATESGSHLRIAASAP